MLAPLTLVGCQPHAANSSGTAKARGVGSYSRSARRTATARTQGTEPATIAAWPVERPRSQPINRAPDTRRRVAICCHVNTSRKLDPVRPPRIRNYLIVEREGYVGMPGSYLITAARQDRGVLQNWNINLAVLLR